MPMVKQPLTIEHSLLGLLYHQPMYGYEIHQRLKASAELGLIWHIKQSCLYATLSRLETDGLLLVTLDRHGRKPLRKMLRLTQSGEAVFLRWLSHPVDHTFDTRLELLAKISFAHHHTQAAHELLARQRQVTKQQLAELHAEATTLDAARSYGWLVLHYRIGQLEAILAWLDRCADWVNQRAAVPLPYPPEWAALPVGQPTT